MALLPPASYQSNARVIPMFVKKRQIKTEVKRQKLRMNVWLFDFRMTVYDQDHSTYKINGHHLESKCPNITTCTLTAAWHCEPILACFLKAGRDCVYFQYCNIEYNSLYPSLNTRLIVTSVAIPATLLSALISRKYLGLSVVPTEFSPWFILTGEKIRACQRALWSGSVWQPRSDPLTSTEQCPCLCKSLPADG